MTELPAVGAEFECRVGGYAPGGHCVARVAGLVVFVRHALPGELVTVRVTEVASSFLRADAIAVSEPSADRIEPLCRYAGPGGCGGCDLQHVAPAARRKLKAAAVSEQLARIAGVTDLPVTVEPLPGGETGWRTRMRYLVGPDGRPGLLRHRSHEVVPVDRCEIAHPEIARPEIAAAGGWPPGAALELAVGTDGRPSVSLCHENRRQVISGSGTVPQRAVGRTWTIPPEAFWQIHPAAADTLASTVVELLAPRPAERAWDLYGGAGLFAAAIAERVGELGRVTVVEGSRRAVEAARRGLADLPMVRVVRADVGAALANPRWRRVDLVVADPPRAGLGAGVVHRIAERRPRAICVVSCDPATFARDVRTFRVDGYRLAELRGFDAFPTTRHVELVGLLLPITTGNSSDGASGGRWSGKARHGPARPRVGT